MTKNDHSILIAAFELAIENYVESGKKSFRRDKRMQRVYRTDAADLRKVLRLFKRKAFADAYAAAWKLDSVPREVIPPNVWKALETTETTL
jgi:hypothetical protein